MKKLLSTFSGIFLLLFSASAQSDCSGDRYQNRTFFTDIDTTLNILYGSNKTIGAGTIQPLHLDVFEPAGDTVSMRPLIILAHGGGFVGGSKSETYRLCNSFAKLGYVAVAIEYRTGYFFLPGLPNQRNTTLAVMNAMHDMKAAIRFFKKDSVINAFAVDTSRIIIGGISAGAITAVHAAYLDNDAEIPSYLTTSDTAGLGGIEGLSGNPGFSSEVSAVVNYAGAIGDTSWIDAGDIPVVSFHYINDPTVPYDTREVKVQTFSTGLTASGSGDMHTRAENVGVSSALKSYTGSGHVEFLANPIFDSVVDITASFLYDNVICKQTTGTLNDLDNEESLTIFPNPSNGSFSIQLNGSSSRISIQNALGEIIAEETISDQQAFFDLNYLSSGLYFITVEAGAARKTGKLLKY